MMQTPVVSCKRIQGDDGMEETLRLCYQLIATPFPSDSEAENATVYSILCLRAEEDGPTFEYEFLFDVSRTESGARELMELLRQGGVTPCSAKAVLEDWL